VINRSSPRLGDGTDVIGLYVKPPQHAAVFGVDEKTAIQALDRLDPVLPLSPGRAEGHGFEYCRHGTPSLFAALNTSSGEVLTQTVPRHSASTQPLARAMVEKATGASDRCNTSTASACLSPSGPPAPRAAAVTYA
jgi:hypothetical protein